MKFFDFFDKLDKVTISERINNKVPINKPKEEKNYKIDDMKEYKRMYYLWNIEKYRKHNTEYRKRQKELKNII